MNTLQSPSQYSDQEFSACWENICSPSKNLLNVVKQRIFFFYKISKEQSPDSLKKLMDRLPLWSRNPLTSDLRHVGSVPYGPFTLPSYFLAAVHIPATNITVYSCFRAQALTFQQAKDLILIKCFAMVRLCVTYLQNLDFVENYLFAPAL